MEYPLDFFNHQKPIPPMNLHRSARKRTPMTSNLADCSLSGSMQSLAVTIASGTDYADEYIQKEQDQMFEASKYFRPEENTFDQMSIGTEQPLDDEKAQELSRLYKTYNLTYTPKANLAIKTIQEKIVAAVAAEPVTIIQGPTGCGKTTQVPQFIMDYCFKRQLPCNIIVTQPRRIAALSIAKRVSEEREWPLGSIVGYKVGLSHNVSQDTRLTYCTTGVLLQRLISTKTLTDFTHIIIDEIHERDQDMDFLLLVVRKLLFLNSHNVKIILMSATFDVKKFSDYFASYVGRTLTPAITLDVEKRNFFQVRNFYIDELQSLRPIPDVVLSEPRVTKDMIEFACRLMGIMDEVDRKSKAESLSKDELRRPGVLVFLPGIHEIEEMHSFMKHDRFSEFKWDIVVLHSSITTEEQQRVFTLPPRGYRRVILSTNIAESSITVPDVKFVVDFCLTKQLTTDPNTNFQCLELTWASKSNCEQRAGRTGRVMDGRVYRLVPKEFYKKLPTENPPEIVKAPLEQVVLRSKIIDLGPPKAILALALDPPDLSNLQRTILLLKESGGLISFDGDEDLDGELTDLGRIMACLPIDIHIGKMIALGHMFSVLREAIIIGASMAVKNMFSSPFQLKLKSYDAKLMWSQYTNSDAISFLHAYNVWMREKSSGRIKTDREEKEWARTSCLQIRVLREIDATVKDITQRLAKIGIKETYGSGKVDLDGEQRYFVLKIVIAGGFYPHYFITHSPHDETSKMKLIGGFDPLKTVYLQGWPFDQSSVLYAKRFQQVFENCSSYGPESIKVNFDNSNRIYVTFSKVERDESEDVNKRLEQIPLPVYRAIKMRSVGPQIEIPVLKPEDSTALIEKLNIPKQKPMDIFSNEQEVTELPSSGARPVLPKLDETDLVISVCRFVDPGHFWAHNKSTRTIQHCQFIKTYIKEIDPENKLKAPTSPPVIGSIVLAPWMSKTKEVSYCRAEVQSVTMVSKQNKFVQVFFVDYGFNQRIALGDLRLLPNENQITELPALAFECVLSNIQPSAMNNLTGGWSKQAIQEFRDLLKTSIEQRGKVYSVVNSVVSMSLTCITQKGDSIDVGNYLIKKGLAEHQEENFLSKSNHEIRQQVKELTMDVKNHYERLQYNQNSIVENYPEPPPKDKCTNVVKMRGPFSPLEVEISSLTNAGSGRKIVISDSSVNSVIMDDNPVNPHQRLLIAGSINESAVTHNLTLYNTTLMPSIPGLLPLLCLIFAPQIELRSNSFGTQYIGVLCGLGYHEKSQHSIFPEHDMPIPFDVEITMTDLQLINQLRHLMSQGIFIDEGNQEPAETILTCQRRINEILFKIINQKRKPVKSEVDLRRSVWCRYNKELFLKPGPFADSKQGIFKLHWALELQEKNEFKESMIEHLTELKKIASMSYRDYLGEPIECKLCKLKVYGVSNLRLHISSDEHHMRENSVK
ncbi:probable ATP-dependent RNA helicase spindle-E [Cotesia glomerata]|uniref:probable ATP-dependent RNA helicase spindle-E n=1 Tax=Cotesia glomerata TaxID=32391 RepID=UPI001D0170B7|nr:probable ATP-dependent RNA helicase spindle-E [Cotesia glomerata]XP_044578371.1 probable ATP-dependent RNA helicase spindle-E [Cotesia glomerata]